MGDDALWNQFLSGVKERGFSFDELDVHMNWPHLLVDELEFTTLETGKLLQLIKEKKGQFMKALKDGIPSLLREISSSPPSILADDDHLPVTVCMRDFGGLSKGEFEKMDDNWLHCWDDAQGGEVPYVTKNNIAILVCGLIKDICMAMGLDLKMFTEVGTFGICPDVCAVTWNKYSNWSY